MSAILGSHRRRLLARWFSAALTVWLMACVGFWVWLGAIEVGILLSICASCMLIAFFLVSSGHDLVGRIVIGIAGNTAITVTSFVTDPAGNLEINNVLAVLFACAVFSRKHEGPYFLFFVLWPIVSTVFSLTFGGGHLVPVLIDAETAQSFSSPITVVSVLVGSAIILISYVSLAEDYERNLKIEANQAKRAEKIKSRFLSNVTHEIRTPLSSLLGLAGLLKDSEQDPARRNMARNLVDVSSNLLSIVNDLLDGAKLDAGKLDVKRESVDLLDVVGGVCNTMRINAYTSHVVLHLDYDCRLPRYVLSDAVRLRQVLLNLLSNAVKFSRPEATSREGFVRVVVKRVENMRALFKVSDNGIGMTKEQVARLFVPFQQADQSISSQFGGTGLGLSIVKALVEEMDGKITVRSEKSKGSMFSVLLPLSADTLRAGDKPEHATRCILFHQNPQLSKIIGRYLESGGFKTKIAESFDDVKRYSSEGYKTLLVLDVQDEQMQNELQSISDISRELKTIGVSSDPSILSLPGVYQIIHSTPLIPSELWDALRLHEDIDDQDPTDVLSRAVNVLVVEDDSISRTVLSRQVEKLGGNSVAVGSVDEAMEAIEKEDFDLVLTDCHLPDGTGPQLAIALQHYFADGSAPSPKIVAVTGHSSDKFKEECFKSGMSGFETKPVNLSRLKEIMESSKVS